MLTGKGLVRHDDHTGMIEIDLSSAITEELTSQYQFVSKVIHHYKRDLADTPNIDLLSPQYQQVRRVKKYSASILQEVRSGISRQQWYEWATLKDWDPWKSEHYEFSPDTEGFNRWRMGHVDECGNQRKDCGSYELGQLSHESRIYLQRLIQNPAWRPIPSEFDTAFSLLKAKYDEDTSGLVLSANTSTSAASPPFELFGSKHIDDFELDQKRFEDYIFRQQNGSDSSDASNDRAINVVRDFLDCIDQHCLPPFEFMQSVLRSSANEEDLAAITATDNTNKTTSMFHPPTLARPFSPHNAELDQPSTNVRPASPLQHMDEPRPDWMAGAQISETSQLSSFISSSAPPPLDLAPPEHGSRHDDLESGDGPPHQAGFPRASNDRRICQKCGVTRANVDASVKHQMFCPGKCFICAERQVPCDFAGSGPYLYRCCFLCKKEGRDCGGPVTHAKLCSNCGGFENSPKHRTNCKGKCESCLRLGRACIRWGNAKACEPCAKEMMKCSHDSRRFTGSQGTSMGKCSICGAMVNNIWSHVRRCTGKKVLQRRAPRIARKGLEGDEVKTARRKGGPGPRPPPNSKPAMDLEMEEPGKMEYVYLAGGGKDPVGKCGRCGRVMKKIHRHFKQCSGRCNRCQELGVACMRLTGVSARLYGCRGCKDDKLLCSLGKV